MQKLAYTILLVFCAAVGTYWITDSFTLPVIVIVLLATLAATLFSRSKQFKNITPNKVLLHLNRAFQECEESAQLILLADNSLSTLQQLQKKRIQSRVDSLLSNDLRNKLPKYPYQPALLLGLFAILIFILIEVFPSAFLFKENVTTTQEIKENSKLAKPITTVAKNITIIAPKYTGLATRQSSNLNIELIAGSTVTWRLQFSGVEQQNELSIKLAGVKPISLIEQVDGHYSASTEIYQAGVYHIAADDKIISDVHTIAVTQDSKPTIRFIEPTQTIIELAKDARPELKTVVSIDDDFGLSRVEILASIASGSGEAVKFRDQIFQFDSESVVNGKTHFVKNWDLAKLEMQPGDELYFSIRAWDNRHPIAQQSRSASKIIRWIEEGQQSILASDTLIDFMPEYFKSQRQIIIETQELLADTNNLSKDQFNRTSRDLGAAQSFLKQKYGQFLGDEFDSGTPQTMEAGPELDHDEHDEEHVNTGDTTATEHQHDETEHQSDNTDKSGYSAIISQFGHAHGEADDGNFIKKGALSPKLLMKRAIANMWQAELHLLLSQPELALPFENQALEFLNRAKKAERIYVKRLGFEPPPVSEKRRYQGDLSDIINYQRNEKTSDQDTDMQSVLALLNILNQNLDGIISKTLTDKQTMVLENVKAYFSEQLATAPQDISFIATLEKIQQSNALALPNCLDCISELRNKLWQILPSPIAAPATNQTPYSKQNTILQKYQAFLQQQEREFRQ